MEQKRIIFSVKVAELSKLEEWLENQVSLKSYAIETTSDNDFSRVSALFSGSQNEFRQLWEIIRSKFSAQNIWEDAKRQTVKEIICMDEEEDGNLAILLSAKLEQPSYAIIKKYEHQEHPRWWKSLPNRYQKVVSYLTPEDQYGCRDEITLVRISSEEFILPIMSELDCDDSGVISLFWTEGGANLQELTNLLLRPHSAFELSKEERKQFKAFQHYIWGGGSDEYYSEVYIKENSVKEGLRNSPEDLGYKGSYIIY